MQEFRYDVFLSYRHKTLDAAVTRRAFQCLEGYRMPPALTQRGYTGIRRVFRDMEELAVSNELSETIVNALHSTRCLIVVCSTDTPSSEWVDREVATFIELGRADYVYALLVNGTPEVSFPKSALRIPDIADRTLDIRTDRGKKAMLRGIPGAVLPVIARCAGCPEAEFLRADKMRRNRAMTARYATSGALLALLVGVSWWLWSLAEAYRQTAMAEQSATMEAVASLTYSLPASLSGLPGTYALLPELLTENIAQMNEILAISRDTDGVEREKAVNLEKLASVYAVLGDGEAAVAASRDAVSQYAGLYARRSDTPSRRDLADGHGNLGNRLGDIGAYQEALSEIERAITLQEITLALTPGLVEARPSLGIFCHNYAANLARLGEYREAIHWDRRAVEILDELAAKGWDIADPLMKTCLSLGASYGMLGEYAASVPWYEKAVATAQARYDAEPTRATLTDLSDANASLASGYTTAGEHALAAAAYQVAIGQKEVLASDADNYAAREALAGACANFGVNLNLAGRYEEAAAWFERAVRIRLALAQEGNPVARASLARAYYSLAENLLDMGKPGEARPYYDECLSVYAPAAEALGPYQRAEYLAREAFYEIVYGDKATALTLAREAIALTPDSSFVSYIYAYALMYAGERDECVRVTEAIAARGETERANFRDDFRMLRGLGLEHPLMAELERLFMESEEEGHA